MFSSLAHFFSKCTFLRLRHFISTWTKSIDPIFHWTLHVRFKFLMKHFLLVATVGMIREKMWWKKWWLVCAFCANLLKKVTKKIRKGKNFLWLIKNSKKFSCPIILCLKYFMVFAKAFRPPSYVLNIRSLNNFRDVKIT